jgi:hypothetical protein
VAATSRICKLQEKWDLHSLGIEDGVSGVHGSIVLGSLTDETLLVGERDEGGGGERTLLVGNDLDIGTLVDGNARVGGTCKASSRLVIEIQ